MAFEFKLPDIGEGVVEGEIVKWLVKPGDSIQVDQPMVEVMTDKATVVIPSPRSGVVVETRGKEGEIAKVHSVLVVIDEQGAKAEAPKTEAPKAEAPKPEAPKPEAPRQQPQRAPEPARQQAQMQPQRAPEPPRAEMRSEAPRPRNGKHAEQAEERAAPGGRVLAAPATRRLARELGIDLQRISGTGPAGRVTNDDVRRATVSGARAETRPEGQAPLPRDGHAPRTPDVAGDQRIPVRGLRKRIWENMVQSSFTAAHFTFVEECDVTELVKTRERFNARVEGNEEKLSFLPFIVKAVVAALKKFPDLNAHVDDDNMEMIRRSEYHLGIAVSTERGLIVPTLRHADRRSILDIAAEIKRLGEAARTAKITPADLGGSTFTITSLGKDGGIFATPIINYPEVAIMGVHKISKRPMVHDDQIVIREMMNLSLSFDHRLIDGHVGAAFTYAVIRLLENPERLMMEMA